VNLSREPIKAEDLRLGAFSALSHRIPLYERTNKPNKMNLP